MKEFFDGVLNWCKTEGIILLIAFVVFWLSLKVINILFKNLDKMMTKRKIDETIKRTTISLGRKLSKFIVFVLFITYLGVETSSIVAVITSIGITIGLALQGSLANFAGGVVILVMHPYKIGNFVEFGGVMGTVEDISLFYTTIRSIDNKIIIVPNSKSGDSVIVNYSIKDTRRLDLTFTISSQNDYRKVKAIIRQIVDKLGYAESDPAPLITLSKYAGDSMDVLVRMWVKATEYWNCNWETLEAIKFAFDEHGIMDAHQQVVVNIKNDYMTPLPIDPEDELVKYEIAYQNAKKKELNEIKQEQENQLQKEKELLEENKTSNKIVNVIKNVDKKVKSKFKKK